MPYVCDLVFFILFPGNNLKQFWVIFMFINFSFCYLCLQMFAPQTLDFTALLLWLIISLKLAS